VPDTSALAVTLISPKGTDVPIVVNRGAGADFGGSREELRRDPDRRRLGHHDEPDLRGQRAVHRRPLPPGGQPPLAVRRERTRPLDAAHREQRRARYVALHPDEGRSPRPRAPRLAGAEAPLPRVQHLPAGCSHGARPGRRRARSASGHVQRRRALLQRSARPPLRRGRATYRSKFLSFGNYGYRLVDLDRDGLPELSAYDERFLYAFTAYVVSAAPPRITQYRNGRLVDVTRRFPS
jgi:hypothetical protein